MNEIAPSNGGRKKAKTLKEEHIQAFAYWISLGKNRTYQAVADYMGVSTETIKYWAFSFDWRNKLKELIESKDEVFVEMMSDISDIRKKSIILVGKVQEWYSQLKDILDVAIKEGRAYTKEELERIKTLRFAISCIDSKGLRALQEYFVGAVRVADENVSSSQGGSINFNGPMFIIKEGSKRLEQIN